MINRTLTKFLPLVFVIAGIFVIVFSIHGLHQQGEFSPAKGVIQDIQEHIEADSEGGNVSTYEVTVSYTIDGKSYTSVMGDFENGYEVGKEIDILYDPQDPNVIVSKGKGPYYYFIAAGILHTSFLVGLHIYKANQLSKLLILYYMCYKS